MSRLLRLKRRVDKHAVLAGALFLVLGVLASFCGGAHVTRLGQRQAQDVLDRRAAVAAWALQGEVDRYRDAVTALAAGVAAQQDFGVQDFDALTAPLLSSRLTGASSVAFLAAAAPGQEAQVSAYWQARGSVPLVPAGTGEHLFLVFSNSLDGVRATTRGRDLAVLPEPAAALRAARSGGALTVSDAYVLLRDQSLPLAQQQQSFVMVTPVYGAPGTAQASKFRGWVLLGLRAGDLAEGTLTDAAQGLINVSLTVTDSTGVPAPSAEVRNGPTSTATRPRVMTVPVLQQRFTLTVASTTAGDELAASYRRTANALRYGGSALSLLLAALAWSLVAGRRHAQRQVEQATSGLRAAEAGARRQAELLDTVMDSIAEGVSVIDATGATVLQNRAAVRLLGSGRAPEEPGEWQEHYGVFLPDGVTPFPTGQLPLMRALRGESPEAVDVVIRHPGREHDVVLSISARPLTSAAPSSTTGSTTGSAAVAVSRDVTQARHLQAQLAAQMLVQQRLLTALSDLGEAVAIVRDGTLSYANDAYGLILGHPVQDLLGTSVTALGADDDAVAQVAALTALLVPGRSAGPVRTRLRHRDGAVVTVEVAAIAVAAQAGDEDGVQVVCLVRDVSEQLRTQAALQTAFDDALIGMCLTGADGRYLRVNATYAAMVGRSREELLTMRAFEINHPEDDPATTLALVRETLAGRREGFRQAKRFVRADGSVGFAELSSVLVRDGEGAPLHFANQVMDITERVLAERERDAQQAMLRAVMDNSQSLIYVRDLDGRYLLANAPLQRAFGRGEADVIGRTDEELHAHVDPAWRARDLRARTGVVDEDDHLVRADGSTAVYESVRFPLHDVHGHLYATCGISLDVTARRQAAEAALESARATSEFLTTMSHEIRTPLNGVLGLMTLLLDTDLDAQQQSWAGAAERSGRALLSIVNDVLDTSKIESGALELEALALDVLAVVDDAVLPLRQLAQQKGLALVLAPARALRPHRMGDPTRLRQVVTNLVANAVKFTDAGTVTVLVAGDDLRVHLTVTDTGLGMTGEQCERLFTPFTQAEASTTRRFGGTGLGLSIVRGLVEQMGGHVSVVSTPGTGSSFRVSLPLTAIEPPLVPVDAPAPAPRVGALRLLVAEDNDINQMVARAVLQAHGMSVDVVDDGAAAVDAVATGRYDAVFMDCRMPGVDGLEATRRIRRLERDGGTARLPIIAMTASAFDADRAACREAGMDGFLPKPWTREQLAQTLADLTRTSEPGRTPEPAPVGGTPVLEPDVPEPDVLQPDVVAEMRAFGEDAFAELYRSFAGQLPVAVAALVAAADGDGGSGGDTLAGAAHRLKGSSGALGAHRLAQLCDGLGRAAGEPEIAGLLAELHEEVSRVEHAVRAVLAR